MNIQEMGAGISHFIHRKRDERLARAAALTFALLSLEAGKNGNQLRAQLFSDAMDKAMTVFLPQTSSPKPVSPIDA
jgi:hypothetical protein